MYMYGNVYLLMLAYVGHNVWRRFYANIANSTDQIMRFSGNAGLVAEIVRKFEFGCERSNRIIYIMNAQQ